jgi:Flp pilus assembly protein TadG
VEFAIILPVILLMTLGLIDLGRAFVYGVAVQEGTRQAARLAINAANDSGVTDQSVLGRLIASSSPALDGCTPQTSPPQICNGITLSVQVVVNGTTYTSLSAAKADTNWATAVTSSGGVKVTAKAAGPVALLPGVSTGNYGLQLPQINIQGQSAMVVL